MTRHRPQSKGWLAAVLIAAGCWVIGACSSIDCPVQTIVSTQYQVCSSDGSALKLTDTLTVTTQRNDGIDTIIYNKGIDTDNFSLPISYSHPEDVLVFSFSIPDTTLTVRDTVWVKKDDFPHFESVDCSASFFHELKEVRHTTNYIGKIEINNSSVNYDQTTIHFLLYPKTDD